MTNVENLYDAVIIGGGPAGLTAAIYLGRACRRVLVVEKDRLGGQIATTANVANYPGVLAASGAELANTMAKQAANFGTEFLAAEVTGLSMDSDVKTVHTSAGDIACLSVLLATGAAPRKIGFGGENDFEGRGVSYCATCDGALFAGKEVIVIGGGYQAAEEAVFLTKYAKKVTVMMRKGDFSCAASVAKAAWDNPKIVFGISQAAYYAAAQAGVKPQAVIAVRACAYSGEELCEFRGTRYKVDSAVMSGADDMRLTLVEKVGAR